MCGCHGAKGDEDGQCSSYPRYVGPFAVGEGINSKGERKGGICSSGWLT